MPAFPRVHIDGAAANALANACLQKGKVTAKEVQKWEPSFDNISKMLQWKLEIATD